MRLIM